MFKDPPVAGYVQARSQLTGHQVTPRQLSPVSASSSNALIARPAPIWSGNNGGGSSISPSPGTAMSLVMSSAIPREHLKSVCSQLKCLFQQLYPFAVNTEVTMTDPGCRAQMDRLLVSIDSYFEVVDKPE